MGQRSLAGRATKSGQRKTVSNFETSAATLFEQSDGYVIGIGVATPEFGIDQNDAGSLAIELGLTQKYKKSLATLYRQSGVHRRQSVILKSDGAVGSACQDFYPNIQDGLSKGPTTAERMAQYERHACDLSLQACRKALKHAAIPSERISHLVTVSCSGFAAPGVDIQLIKQLELPASTQRTNVGFMGCHGALNGLRVANAFCRAEPDAVVLVCATELCSLHQQYSDNAQQLVANSLFADGSAALVIQAASSFQAVTDDLAVQADVARWPLRIVRTGSHLLPETQQHMSWRIADHGFEMSLSPQVPEIVKTILADWVDQFLAKSGLRSGDIDNWIIHPGGPRIVSVCGEALGLADEALRPSFSVLEDHGNMSSPTVLFVLERLCREQQLGDYQMMLGFGPGLCIEAALLSTSDFE